MDVYQGDDVTVDFYRDLRAYDYKFIVFRAHSGAIGPNPHDPKSTIGTYLFTNESYTEIKHTSDQLNDELAKAMVAEGYPYFFAICPKFITHSMAGNFDNTLIIIAGCSCLYNQDLAQAFTQKGTSAYLAWDATVDLLPDRVGEGCVKSSVAFRLLGGISIGVQHAYQSIPTEYAYR